MTGIAFLCLAKPVSAQTVVFSDDFSGDLEKWHPTRDVGQYWQISNGRLEVTVPFSSSITELVPKDHYWDSRWHAISFEFEFTALAGADQNFSFGVQDPCNWYETHFVYGGVDVVRLLNCQVAFGQQFYFELRQNQTYHIQITFNEGTIQTFVDQALVFETTDWSFNQNYGKIGLKAGTGSVYPTTVAFDNVKVSLLDAALGVPLLKQSDPKWAEVEYDKGSRWSPQPSIARWGCALVSVVMILNYHGITHFPDGSALTPLTLNTWLNSQPDGYIGDGLLNWLAITRLTFELSNHYQTPKLEYAAHKENLIEKVADEIGANQPVILQIDGHFLVADGVNQLKDDLLIKDPAYTYTYFSQHTTELLSVRSFQPSQTDLSYLMIAHQPELTVALTKAGGDTPAGLVEHQEILRPSLGGAAESTSLSQLLLPKPVAGSYTLSLSQSILGPFSVDLYVYDQRGDPTHFEVTGMVGPQTKNYTLIYSLEEKPTLTNTLTWRQFRQDVYQIKQMGGFWGWPVFWLLEWTVYQAEVERLPYAPEILRVIALQLSSYRPWMTESSYRYLAQQLNTLGP